MYSRALQQRAVDLIYFRKSQGPWPEDQVPKPLDALLASFSAEVTTIYHFMYEPLLETINRYFARHPEILEKDSNPRLGAAELLEAMKRTVEINTGTQWIVVPLRDATLTRSTAFERFALLGGKRETKLRWLSRLTGMTAADVRWFAKHTETSRAPYFFDPPLLAIRVVSWKDYARLVAENLGYLCTAVLQAMYCAQKPDQKDPLPHIRPIRWEDPEHIAIYSSVSWRRDHVPFRYNSRCNFPLNWMLAGGNQKLFVDIYKAIVEESSTSPVGYCFRKGLRFFSKAIEAEDTRDFREGLGLSTLYLAIAVESILMAQGSRFRIAALLPRLAGISRPKIAEACDAIDRCYRKRSVFVHEGDDVGPDWVIDGNTGMTEKGPFQRSLDSFRHLVARLITSVPTHVHESGGDLKRWRSKLDSLWGSVLSGRA